MLHIQRSYQDQIKIVQDLAKNWKISEDGIKYTFKLRSDVFFHESKSFGENLTRTVNATDFEYSFNRILDPNLGSPGLWAVKNIKDFEAINDSIFTITLNKPFPAFLGMLSMKYFSASTPEIASILLTPAATAPSDKMVNIPMFDEEET